jgi:hypothetical protein
MSRIRSIKPEFFMDDELASRGPLAALLFAGLWTLADREGRLTDRPARIKACVLPYYECDIDALLGSLAPDFIERYEVGGERLIQVLNFTRHQCPNVKELPSTIPAPCQHDASTPLIGREGKEGKGRGGRACAREDTPPPGDIAKVGSEFEKRTGKTAGSALVSLCADHPTDILLEAIKRAAESGKTSPAYIRAVAEGLTADGWKASAKKPRGEPKWKADAEKAAQSQRTYDKPPVVCAICGDTGATLATGDACECSAGDAWRT